jgi:hypothetical protein
MSARRSGSPSDGPAAPWARRAPPGGERRRSGAMKQRCARRWCGWRPRIPGPNGGVWFEDSIRGGQGRRDGILRNPAYDGRLVWNRRQNLKDPVTGALVRRQNPSDAHVEVPAEKPQDRRPRSLGRRPGAPAGQCGSQEPDRSQCRAPRLLGSPPPPPPSDRQGVLRRLRQSLHHGRQGLPSLPAGQERRLHQHRLAAPCPSGAPGSAHDG